eukprot:10678201-Alexandrium_andersonii.AAC.1
MAASCVTTGRSCVDQMPSLKPSTSVSLCTLWAMNMPVGSTRMSFGPTVPHQNNLPSARKAPATSG